MSQALQSVQHVAARRAGVSRKLNGTKCAKQRTRPYQCCNLATRPLMWQQHATGKRDQHVVEIFAMDADDNRQNVENETSVSDTESTDGREHQSTIQTATFTTWNPPHVEKTQSILQLHLEDDDRRRFDQCIRLEIRGSVRRLREQQAHEVMVNVRRENEMRPFRVLTNLGSKEWNNGNDEPVQHQEGQREKSPEPGTPTCATMGESLARSEGVW